MKVMQQVLSGDVVPPSAHVPELPTAVDAMILWMLAKERTERPPSGVGLAAQIESVLAAPHDAQAVSAARDAHLRRRAREEAVANLLRMVAGAVGALAFSWLMREMLSLRPEQGEASLGELYSLGGVPGPRPLGGSPWPEAGEP